MYLPVPPMYLLVPPGPPPPCTLHALQWPVYCPCALVAYISKGWVTCGCISAGKYTHIRTCSHYRAYSGHVSRTCCNRLIIYLVNPAYNIVQAWSPALLVILEYGCREPFPFWKDFKKGFDESLVFRTNISNTFRSFTSFPTHPFVMI